MLFPVFARARETARRTVCTSNLRQHAQAVAMYAQDYDERFPVANFSENRFNYPPNTHRHPDSSGVFLSEVLQPYQKNRAVHFCPTIRNLSWRSAYLTDYSYLCVHGWSQLPGFGFFDNDRQGVCDHALAAIARSAEKPMVICDGLGEHVGFTTQQVFNGGRPGGPVGGQNIAYVDGHVKLTPGTYERIVSLYTLPNE